MIVPFIPFFLAVRIAVDGDTWKYGPEYVFDVHSTSSMTQVNNSYIISEYISAQMYCRPKSLDVLSCFIVKGKIVKDHPWSLILGKESTHMGFDFSKEPFEIKFNNFGIDHIVVEESLSLYQANMIKDIAQHLSIGIDLNGLADGVFETKEYSTIGECDTDIQIYHYPTSPKESTPEEKRIEFQSLPQLNKVLGETIELEKSRNTKNCSSYAPHFFAMHTEDPETLAKFTFNLMNSFNRIVVSDTSFSSITKSKGTVSNTKRKMVFSIIESLSVVLKDIQPAAKEELPTMYNPYETDLVVDVIA